MLGIDLGTVRIGLALSDPLGITAQPAGVLRRRGPRADLEALAALVRDREVTRIVVGYPLLLSGEAGIAAKEAEEFAGRFRERLPGVPIDLWDERWTTKEVERTLIAADVSRRKRRQVVDSLAAVLILQGFMERHPQSPTGS